MGRKTVSLLEQVIVEGLQEYPPSTRGFTALVVNYVNERTGGRNLSPSQLTSWLQAARKRNQFPGPGAHYCQWLQRSPLANSLTSTSYQSTTQMPTSPPCFPGGPHGKDDDHGSWDDDGSESVQPQRGAAPCHNGVPQIARQSRHSLGLIMNPSQVSNSRETSSMRVDFSSPSQSTDPLPLNPEFPQPGDVVSSAGDNVPGDDSVAGSKLSDTAEGYDAAGQRIPPVMGPGPPLWQCLMRCLTMPVARIRRARAGMAVGRAVRPCWPTETLTTCRGPAGSPSTAPMTRQAKLSA
ncbi:hypothetical protein B0H14DRAFT_1312871 [Mycena olivaceomarginata]|nr:hypothetical protein B0H14DRAFT_1312871 [Mycena olivaceomarginata]